MTVEEYFLVVLGLVGISISAFLVLPMLLYLKGKPMEAVEDVMDEGKRFYSLNIFTAGHGALFYGSLFLFDWHARRYKSLEKRENIPAGLRRLFVLYYVLFMLSFFLLLGVSVWIWFIT